MSSLTTRVGLYKPADDGSEPPSVSTDLNGNWDIVESRIGVVPTVSLPASCPDGKIVQVAGRVWVTIGAQPGGAWVELAAKPLFGRQTSDQAVSSATTGTTLVDTTMSITGIPSGLFFDFESFWRYSAHTTGKLKIALTAPNNATMDWLPLGKEAGQPAGSTGENAWAALEIGGQPWFNGNTTDGTSKMTAAPKGIFFSGDGGTLTVRMAQTASFATATTMWTNSFIKLSRLN
jgi:hypothetical protein